MLRGVILLLLILCFPGTDPIKKELKRHVEYLSSDALQGRETGTVYEKKAGEYIKSEFESLGLAPGGVNGTFYQDFEFLNGRSLGPDGFLKIGHSVLTAGKDYFPLTFSSPGQAQGISVFKDAEGFSYNKDTSYKQEQNERSENIYIFDISHSVDANKGIVWNFEFLHKIAKESGEAGAKAVVFYDCDPGVAGILNNLNEPLPLLKIPVVLLLKPSLIDKDKEQVVELNIDLKEDRRTGRNVLAWLDNGADNTVIIGAHYDHIGVTSSGKPGGKGFKKLINHGADDNASGVAVMIVLAKQFSKEEYRLHNYLFASFSGEELGLLGSTYFSNHPTLSLSGVNFMINLDQIGRMNKEKTLIINGTSTSPAWQSILNEIEQENVSLKTNQSGVSLRDHASFYLKNIPVLDFYTGMNEDYHQPTDVASKINYEGLEFVFDVICKINSFQEYKSKIPFSATNDSPELIKYMERLSEYSFGQAGN